MSGLPGAGGLLVLTDLPDLGRVAVLNRRGEYDVEKMREETYCGLCQVTAIGGRKFVEGRPEGPGATMCREVEEELGVRAWSFFERKYINNTVDLVKTECTLITAALMPPKFLELVRLHPSSGGFVFVQEQFAKDIRVARKGAKRIMYYDPHWEYMFAQERAAVIRAFDHYRNVAAVG